MYAHILMVDLGPGMRDEGGTLAERWTAAAATIPGFVDVTFFGDDEQGQYGYFSLWDTRKHADNAINAVGPQLTKSLLKHARKPPTVRVYEVYKPRDLR